VSGPRAGIARPSATVALAILAALVVVAVPTLTPTPRAVPSSELCIICGSLGGVDFVLNVVLFTPLGAAVWNARRRLQDALIAGLLVSVVIELLQLRIIVGRDATLGDILANTAGSVAGAAIALGFTRWRDVTGRAAQRGAAIAGIAAAMVFVISAQLLQPIRTRYPQWVQWAPEKRGEEPFRGRLETAEANGRTLHGREVLRPPQTLDARTRSLRVRATLKGPTPRSNRQAIIIRIANPLEEGFQLAQLGDGVVFRTNIVASRLRLRPLLIGLPDVLPDSSATTEVTFMFDGVSSPASIVATGSGPDEQLTTVTLPRTVGLAWALFLPWSIAIGPQWWLVNACWLATLVVPVSFFSMRSRRSSDAADTVTRWWPVALVVVMLAALPLVTGLSSLRAIEWLGVVAGVLGGIMMERWLGSRPTIRVRSTDRLGHSAEGPASQ
jgi:VanZ family protein